MEQDYSSMSIQELDALIKERGLEQPVPAEVEVPTDTPPPPTEQVQQPSTEEESTGKIRNMNQVYQDRVDAGGSPFRPGV